MVAASIVNRQLHSLRKFSSKTHSLASDLKEFCPTMKPTPPQRQVNWTALPDPLREEEVKLELNWTADERIRQAILRQAALMGFESPTAYLLQALAATIAGNEEDTIISNDGRILHASCDGYGKDGLPQNVCKLITDCR
jgi:hypothetical protein